MTGAESTGNVALVAVTTLLVIATVLPIQRHEQWWIRGFDFPRLQFSAISLVIIIGALVQLPSPLAAFALVAAGACFVYQALWILPYSKLRQVEVPASSPDQKESISILTANVLMPNRGAERLIALIKQYSPDVFVTLESDQWWQDQLAAVEGDYPYSIKCPLDNLYGMHVYSRLPLTESTIEYLVEDDIPSMHTLLNLHTGTTIRCHFLHPAPPSPTENELSKERDAELIAVAKSVAGSELPVIVTGDLNDVAWSATTRLFRKISGLLDPRIGRGMYNTFNAKWWFMRWPLDHLFHSHHFRTRRIERLPSFGSDHFGLLTELTYEPAAGSSHQAQQQAQQPSLVAEPDDRQWAQDKMSSEDIKPADVPKPGEPDN